MGKDQIEPAYYVRAAQDVLDRLLKEDTFTEEAEGDAAIVGELLQTALERM